MMNEYLPSHSVMDKKPKLNYYFRLESESSINSDEDTESVNSVQDRETEIAQDPTDTGDSDTYFEYEIASSSEGNGDGTDSDLSRGGTDIDDLHLIIGAVLGDTSLEAWAPDGDDSSISSTTDNEEFTEFWNCAQCKSKNNNPRLRLCESCFQVRKTFYPPRPKRCKKRKIQSNKEAVNVDNLRSCLSGLTDSGVGSSQEFSALNFKEIKVPKQHLNRCNTPPSSSELSTASFSGISTSSKDNIIENEGTTSRKRKLSDSFSDNEVRPKRIIIEGPLKAKNPVSETKLKTEDSTDLKEMCIICDDHIKDGIFLHGKSAHSCCCYRCALKTWKTTKRCPVCSRHVNNVVKLYTI